jgi:hypothetical protein
MSFENSTRREASHKPFSISFLFNPTISILYPFHTCIIYSLFFGIPFPPLVFAHSFPPTCFHLFIRKKGQRNGGKKHAGTPNTMKNNDRAQWHALRCVSASSHTLYVLCGHMRTYTRPLYIEPMQDYKCCFAYV